MIITMKNTETREISAKIDELHEERGEAALGRVLTLLISMGVALDFENSPYLVLAIDKVIVPDLVE